MDNYYAEKLNSKKLFQAYDTQIPRIKQYLQAEIDFVKGNLSNTQSVLELGAGYGRIIRELAPYCRSIVGIDISLESVELGKEYLKDYPNASIVAMDVHQIKFPKPFDVILCLQNGCLPCVLIPLSFTKFLIKWHQVERLISAVTALDFGIFV